MNWCLGSGLVIGVVAAAFNGDQPTKLIVCVYNYAGLQPKLVSQTQTEAARIFRHAGIEMDWRDCPPITTQQSKYPACDAPVGPATLSLRLLPRSMAELYPSVQDSFGFALQTEDGAFGTTANVFVASAAQLAARRGMSQGALLGTVVAHELGHLLLGAHNRSMIGIMHVPWHEPELTLIEQGGMLFTSQESQRMQAGVRARMEKLRRSSQGNLSNTGVVSAGINLDRSSEPANLGSRRFRASPLLKFANDSAPASKPTLYIHVYNQAAVPIAALRKAVGHAESVLESAGVRNICSQVLPDAPEAHSFDLTPAREELPYRDNIVLAVVADLKFNPFPSSAMGYALPTSRAGVNAVIFYDRIRNFSRLHDVDLSRLLGLAMAHEIGHVLIGSNDHGTAGLMKTTWTKEDFHRLSRLAFTKTQRAQIRRRMSRTTRTSGQMLNTKIPAIQFQGTEWECVANE